ncbi:hypothetical protein RchiOBHm_Chr5g0005491 [Rosa chinensis]|uniref:Uncharacterized protein n=1 Tax=Rosa chinensis TaxID=74649 RepID=A0A2P6Q3A2_ROSCH|nr:hypothetical protein RchiOBHm_Chr5g0005491 [Rosa chinensis]
MLLKVTREDSEMCRINGVTAQGVHRLTCPTRSVFDISFSISMLANWKWP